MTESTDDTRRRVAAAVDDVFEQWIDGLNGKRPQDAITEAILAALPNTCDASMHALGGEPVGPCILRAGHDGPVHQDATGAKWWPRTDPALILGS